MGVSPQKAILVVEDEQAIREPLVEIIQLKAKGFTVLSAENGHQGLQTIKENNGKIRLIITDHTMKGMTGGEMLAELDRDGIGNVPRIVLSGSPLGSFKGGRYSCWLEKPAEIDILIKKIYEYLYPEFS